jgi:high-affinity iron transporter
MAASFVLSLREGLEAALILGIVLGILRRTNRTEFYPPVWRGAGAAATASLVVALLLNLLNAEFEGSTEVIFEGVTMLLAAGLLTWMIFWMRKQTREMTASIETQVLRASRKVGGSGLFWVAFVSILREGVELAVYLMAARLESNAIDTIAGTLAGLTAAGLLGWLTFRTTWRLKLGLVFRTTNLVLILFAAGLIASGVHELIEINWIPAIIDPVWNINGLLSDQSSFGGFLKALLGYNGSPALSEVLAYLAYLVVIGSAWFLNLRPALEKRRV